ncbi:MAG: ABC transporter permease, partial [Bacteroidota bacterium]
KGLTYGDARAISQDPLVERMSAFSSTRETPVRSPGGEEKRTDLVEGDDRFLGMFSLPLASGRNLTSEDLLEHRRVTVIGDDLAKKLFPGEDPVGKEVVLKGDRYRVVGKLEFASKQGFHLGFSFSDLAIVPLKHAEGRVNMVALASRDSSRNSELLDRINAILLHRHNGVDDFQFLDFGGLLKGFYAAFFGMILVVGLISGVSLLIGGVGIMNIMLVAVAERKREIGLRKAVGGSRDTILAQFLMEALVLSLFGALIGVLLGCGLAQLAAMIGPMINRGWVGVVSQPAIALAILASAMIGLFFGWYPARQAAESDPILCLRSE